MCELYLNTMAIKIPLKYIYLHFSLSHTMKFKRYLILVNGSENTLAFHPCLRAMKTGERRVKPFFYFFFHLLLLVGG